jgi:hypothetical protein
MKDLLKRGAGRRGLVAGAAMLSVAAVAMTLTLIPREAMQPATRSPYDPPVAEVAQAMNCETPAGVCQLPSPQPVGSLCQCPGGSTGRAIL